MSSAIFIRDIMNTSIILRQNANS